MKNRHVIAYLTVMLILFQSFSAIANLQDFHVMDAEHLQHEHQHNIEHDTVNSAVNSAEQNVDDRIHSSSNASKSTANVVTENHNPADCHHCGHCHGTHVQWLGQAALQSVKTIQQSHQFYYLTGMFDSPVNRLLRPPKV